jgi:hypothetical protein
MALPAERCVDPTTDEIRIDESSEYFPEKMSKNLP